jgi:DNA modification methylase
MVLREASPDGHVPSRLEVTYLNLEDLKPDPANARLHPRRQLKLLADSIQALGFNVPILVDRDRNVLAGHARLLAAQRLGISAVPTIRLEHLTPTQVQAFRIADNRLAEIATWDENLLAQSLKELSAVDLDFNIEATGFSVGEIDLRIEGLGDGADDPADSIPPRAAVAVSRPGDLWVLGDHRILCGSALEAVSYDRLMARDRAAMVLSDPPYNIPIDGFVGGNGAIKHREFAMGVGEMSAQQFEAFLGTVMDHCIRTTTDGSLHYFFMDWRHTLELQTAAATRYSAHKHTCVWDKGRGGMGSFYRSEHEFCLIYKAGKAASRNNIELGRNGRNRTNIWKYPGIVNERRGDEGDLLAMHPTSKPVRMLADAILDVTAPRETVLDPFLGSGSTLIAAHRVGRVAYGIEIDPLYVDVAIRRWQADTGQDAVLADTGESFAVRSAASLNLDAQGTSLEIANEIR